MDSGFKTSARSRFNSCMAAMAELQTYNDEQLEKVYAQLRNAEAFLDNAVDTLEDGE